MAQWELWLSSDDTGHMFFREDNSQARDRAKAEAFTLDWTVEAVGHNAAKQALYDHLGWGLYKPVLRDDGTPYPEVGVVVVEETDDDTGIENGQSHSSRRRVSSFGS